jgi:integrase
LQFFSEVYRPRRLLGGSPETIRLFLMTIRHYGNWLGREPLITDLDEDRISEFLAYRAELGLSLETVWTERKHLVALGNYAHKRGLIAVAPDVERIRTFRRAPQSYNVEDIARLLAAGRECRGVICGIPARLFYPALFLTAYDTGGRAGGLWSLRWQDYDERGPILLFRAGIPGQTMKQTSDLVIRISDQTAFALLRIRKPEREMIFPWDKSPPMRNYYIHKILIAAGLPHGRRDQLQRIRRTTATMAHNLHVDATAQLGHTSDVVTRRHYLDMSNQKQAADVLPRPTISSNDPQLRLF